MSPSYHFEFDFLKIHLERKNTPCVKKSWVFRRIVKKNFVFKGISVHGAWMYKNTEAPQLMQVIRDSSPQLDKQITHRLPLSQAPVAFDLQSRGECGKIILHPWDD